MPADLRDATAPARVRRFGRLLWVWGPALSVMAAIYAVSSLQDLAPLPGNLSDKTGHLGGYAVLGALVIRATSGVRWRGVTGRSALVAWLICVVYGASDELHQAFVPGRTVAFDDWVADAAGAAMAILTVRVVAGLMRRRERTV
jgi:VanZ family protein